ncbi:hypothetical protein YC2023_037774 [Brassica napus]
MEDLWENIEVPTLSSEALCGRSWGERKRIDTAIRKRDRDDDITRPVSRPALDWAAKWFKWAGKSSSNLAGELGNVVQSRRRTRQRRPISPENSSESRRRIRQNHRISSDLITEENLIDFSIWELLKSWENEASLSGQNVKIPKYYLGTIKSLIQAMACCTMFHKCAMDPLCYSHIELRDNNVDDGVVRTMIRRAGNELRSLQLGHVVPARSTTSLLTESCLHPLFDNNSFIGYYYLIVSNVHIIHRVWNCLRSVHLYNLKSTYEAGLAKILACSNITDLKIVGQFLSNEIFSSFTAKSCRRVEHLFLEARGIQCLFTQALLYFATVGSIIVSGLLDLVTTIPNLTSLTLIGFGLDDATAHSYRGIWLL